jgi:hypothetical protein
MLYITHEGKEQESPKTATHYSKHPSGKINQFYRTENDMIQYLSIFGEWKKSNLTQEEKNDLIKI